MGKINKSNTVKISGRIVGGFELDHQILNEKFYTNYLAVARTSGVVDVIPIIVSEFLINLHERWEGRFVCIAGSYRSYNKHNGQRNRLVLYVFADNIEEISNTEDDENSIILSGYLCRPITYRQTPLGREIADLLLAVNRSYGKSDYIPCIAWGRNARRAEQLNIGAKISLAGRIQSRNTGKIFEGEESERIAYEVSISRMDEARDGEEKPEQGCRPERENP